MARVKWCRRTGECIALRRQSPLPEKGRGWWIFQPTVTGLVTHCDWSCNDTAGDQTFYSKHCIERKSALNYYYFFYFFRAFRGLSTPTSSFSYVRPRA